MFNTIQALVGEGNMQEAISQMSKWSVRNADIRNSVIQLSGQYAQANFSFAMGLMDAQAQQAALSKITYALLQLLDRMQAEGLFSEKDLPSEAETEGPKTKMLFLGANPVFTSGHFHLELEKEYLEIRKIFKNHRNKFSITEELDMTLDAFFESVHREKPNIIHIAVLGGKEGVYFLQKSDRTPHLVPYEFLAPVFRMLKETVECVFLNTVDSNLFAKVVSRVIPYAIGIRGNVIDHEAISFASGFYAALALEKNYEKAFEAGRHLLTNTTNAPGGASLGATFFLYQNGHCAEDTETPDDFYIPKETPKKSKK